MKIFSVFLILFISLFASANEISDQEVINSLSAQQKKSYDSLPPQARPIFINTMRTVVLNQRKAEERARNNNDKVVSKAEERKLKKKAKAKKSKEQRAKLKLAYKYEKNEEYQKSLVLLRELDQEGNKKAPKRIKTVELKYKKYLANKDNLKTQLAEQKRLEKLEKAVSNTLADTTVTRDTFKRKTIKVKIGLDAKTSSYIYLGSGEDMVTHNTSSRSTSMTGHYEGKVRRGVYHVEGSNLCLQWRDLGEICYSLRNYKDKKYLYAENETRLNASSRSQGIRVAGSTIELTSILDGNTHGFMERGGKLRMDYFLD